MNGEGRPGIRRPAAPRTAHVSAAFAQQIAKYGASPRLLRSLRANATSQAPEISQTSEAAAAHDERPVVEATAEAERLPTEGSTYVEILLLVAQLLEKVGDRAGAEENYRKAADRGDTSALIGLARLRERAGDQTEAERLYREAADLDDTSLNLVRAYLQRQADAGEARAVDASDGVSTAHTNPSFEAFFLAEFKNIVRSVMLAGVSYEEAEDAVQEAMVLLAERWSEGVTPRSWVRRVALRTAIRKDQRQQVVRRREIQALVDEPVDSPSRSAQLLGAGPDDPVDVDLQAAVREALRALPPSQRAVMALTLDGFSSRETAEVLAISPGTVRTTLSHARRRLQQVVERSDITNSATGSE